MSMNEKLSVLERANSLERADMAGKFSSAEAKSTLDRMSPNERAGFERAFAERASQERISAERVSAERAAAERASSTAGRADQNP